LIIAISGVLFAPLALPILPVKTFIGIGPSNYESKELAQLPQFYSDMFGWDNMAVTLAGVYHALPAEEREKTIVFAQNYGEAGAIGYYRKKYDLPAYVCRDKNVDISERWESMKHYE